MAHTETATNNSSTEPSSRPSRRKRWVAAASCVGLVAAIAGGGYWWHSTRVPNLTRVEAWTRYIELIEGGKYDEALSYSPYLQGPHDDGDSIEFLSDAAHAHAPSTISIEPVDNIDNPYSIEGTFPSMMEQTSQRRSSPFSHRRTRPTASSAGGTLKIHLSEQRSACLSWITYAVCGWGIYRSTTHKVGTTFSPAATA